MQIELTKDEVRQCFHNMNLELRDFRQSKRKGELESIMTPADIEATEKKLRDLTEKLLSYANPNDDTLG